MDNPIITMSCMILYDQIKSLQPCKWLYEVAVWNRAAHKGQKRVTLSVGCPMEASSIHVRPNIILNQSSQSSYMYKPRRQKCKIHTEKT